MNKAIYYRDSWLMPNSDAYKMYQEWKSSNDPKKSKDLKEKLDKHMKMIETTYLALTKE